MQSEPRIVDAHRQRARIRDIVLAIAAQRLDAGGVDRPLLRADHARRARTHALRLEGTAAHGRTTLVGRPALAIHDGCDAGSGIPLDASRRTLLSGGIGTLERSTVRTVRQRTALRLWAVPRSTVRTRTLRRTTEIATAARIHVLAGPVLEATRLEAAVDRDLRTEHHRADDIRHVTLVNVQAIDTRDQCDRGRTSRVLSEEVATRNPWHPDAVDVHAEGVRTGTGIAEPVINRPGKLQRRTLDVVAANLELVTVQG